MKRISAPFPLALAEIAAPMILFPTGLAVFLSNWARSLEFDQKFNLLEGILWFSMAAAILLRSRRRRGHRDLVAVTVAAFILFGVSDVWEVWTRAWYRPVWLLLLKAACLAAVLKTLAVYRKRKKRGAA